MAKQSRKLSLKKETLRSLDGRELEQVAGGYFYSDLVMLKQPSKTFSGGCTTELFAFDLYRFYY